MSETKRCNAVEREQFTRRSKTFPAQHGEPALGTLDERLGIIVRRLGGKTGAVRMSDDERREYELWLQAEGLSSVA